MGGIDRKRVRRSFGRQAAFYDDHAHIQKTVVARLLEILREQKVTPGIIVDVGTGTGSLLKELIHVHPEARVIGIDLAPEMSMAAKQKTRGEGRAYVLAADAEQLPLADGECDLILSASTFQWLERLEPAFSEALRVLAPGGLFCFAMFTGSTLHELKTSYRYALSAAGLEVDRTHDTHTVEEVEMALAGAGFLNSCLSVVKYLESHSDVPALLRSLKAIGAGNAAGVATGGLSGRKVMSEMMSFYGKNFSVDGKIPATYEVVYGVGRKAGLHFY